MAQHIADAASKALEKISLSYGTPSTGDMFKAAAGWPKIVLFGDSLIQQSVDKNTGGFSITLLENVNRRADLILRGFSGYTTRWLLPALHHILQDPLFSRARPAESSVAGFFILLGANDSALPASETGADFEQHVPVNEYVSNLRDMIRMLETECRLPRKRIVLVSPPPVAIYKWMDHYETEGWDLKSFNRRADAVVPYVEAVRRVANDEKVGFVDLYGKLKSQPKWQSLFVDGVHFSEAGNFEVAELFKPKIDELLKQMDSGGDQIFPDWKVASTVFSNKSGVNRS